MPVTLEEIEYLRRLEPQPSHWGGTGALTRRIDSRDYPAIWHPGYRAVAEAGAATDTDWSDKVCSLTDQQATGACVVHSTCYGIQVNEEISSSVCFRFNPGQFYAELGGTGSNGIDSGVCLKKCVDVGAPLANSSERVRVGSYFWIDPNPATFAQAIKTALTAKKSVVIALLLPSTFGGRWTPGNPTTGYHQVDIVGTKDDLFWGPNSWGAGWGGGPHPAGFYELSFSYCVQDGMQHSYCYAYFFDAVAVGPGPPPPPPPSQRTLSAVATGTGISLLAVGQDLAAGNVNLHITQISDGNPPPPPPPSLTVTGYDPNPVESTHPVSILGSGFTSAPVVLWNSQRLSANRVSDTQISAVAPTVTSSTSGAVTVQIGTASATGPGLTVTPPGGGGGGGGGGDLLVTLTPGRGHWLYAVVQDRQTQEYLTSTCHCTVGGVDLGVSTTTKQAPSALAARWYYGSHTGQAVVNVSTSDHRSGTASLQL